MKATFLAAIAILLLGCSASQLDDPPPLSDIADILADPAAHDGRLIRIQGASIVRFEASFICPTPETLDLPDSSKKCLWINPGDPAYGIGQLDRKTVEIIGRFYAKDHGHMGLFGGAIAVTRGKITGSHNMRESPPPPPPPGSSANNSFKPTLLRNAA